MGSGNELTVNQAEVDANASSIGETTDSTTCGEHVSGARNFCNDVVFLVLLLNMHSHPASCGLAGRK